MCRGDDPAGVVRAGGELGVAASPATRRDPLGTGDGLRALPEVLVTQQIATKRPGEHLVGSVPPRREEAGDPRGHRHG
jgi:hypothetical protein